MKKQNTKSYRDYMRTTQFHRKLKSIAFKMGMLYPDRIGDSNYLTAKAAELAKYEGEILPYEMWAKYYIQTGLVYDEMNKEQMTYAQQAQLGRSTEYISSMAKSLYDFLEPRANTKVDYIDVLVSVTAILIDEPYDDYLFKQNAIKALKAKHPEVVVNVSIPRSMINYAVDAEVFDSSGKLLAAVAFKDKNFQYQVMKKVNLYIAERKTINQKHQDYFKDKGVKPQIVYVDSKGNFERPIVGL